MASRPLAGSIPRSGEILPFTTPSSVSDANVIQRRSTHRTTLSMGHAGHAGYERRYAQLVF